MKILMILQSDFPPDIRIEKEATALINAKHQVHLVCKNVKGRVEEEKVNKFYIHRLKAFKSIFSKINKILMFPLPINPIWKTHINSIIESYNIDVIHVHDLPLTPLAIKIGKKYSLTVIFDMHENYPAALKAWQKRGFDKFIKNATIAKWIEKRAISKVDQIIVVVEEQKKRLIKLGINPKKIHIVSNTVDLERFCQTKESIKIKENIQSDFIITYVGTITENRGLDTLINGFAIANKKIKSAKLIIIGEGKLRKKLEKLAFDLNIEENVIFKGWIDYKNVPDYVAASDVGLIPQPSNEHADTTIPHKLFQYMALKKPVIVSSAKPLARIVSECKCGNIFKSNSSDELAKAIIEIYNSDYNYGKNGYDAIIKKYNWNLSSKELLKLYRNF